MGHLCYPDCSVTDDISFVVFVFFRAQMRNCTLDLHSQSEYFGQQDNGRTKHLKQQNTFHSTVIIVSNCVPKTIMQKNNGLFF